MKDPNKVKQGKKNKASGKRFETKVREDLDRQGWLVFRNNNNCELVSSDPQDGNGYIFKTAKRSFNPYTRFLGQENGFPDFVCIRQDIAQSFINTFEVMFVECKCNGYLSAEEKDKAHWIATFLNIPVIVAYKGKKRGEIVYEEFKKKPTN